MTCCRSESVTKPRLGIGRSTSDRPTGTVLRQEDRVGPRFTISFVRVTAPLPPHRFDFFAVPILSLQSWILRTALKPLHENVATAVIRRCGRDFGTIHGVSRPSCRLKRSERHLGASQSRPSRSTQEARRPVARHGTGAFRYPFQQAVRCAQHVLF